MVKSILKKGIDIDMNITMNIGMFLLKMVLLLQEQLQMIS